jgi:hypothetical protein
MKKATRILLSKSADPCLLAIEQNLLQGVPEGASLLKLVRKPS